VTPFLGSRNIINRLLNHKRVTNISYIPNPVPELQCCKGTYISAQSNGELSNSNSNAYTPYNPTVTTEIFLILVFCTVGHTVLKHSYRVLNSAEPNPYYHYSDTKISISPPIESTRYKRPNSI
jgi:hypothetical protein